MTCIRQDVPPRVSHCVVSWPSAKTSVRGPVAFNSTTTTTTTEKITIFSTLHLVSHLPIFAVAQIVEEEEQEK